MSAPISYRPDIDGLRAIAVLLVILFHAGATLLPGGFIGVDVFFVISGFLITSIIHKELGKKTFSFNNFYKRRITRILPAFYTVLFASFIAAVILLTPGDLKNFIHSARYAVGFLSNLYFYRHTGYFAPASEQMPLLHTWSLSIEEQFYIFWPILLILLSKYFSVKKLLVVSASLTAVLLAYAEISTQLDSEQAYYLLPSRAFELMIGATLAFLPKPQVSSKNQQLMFQLLGALGLALIIIPALIYSEETLFPGLNAFYPCAGAALLIYTGNTQTYVSKLLSLRGVVFTGLLSYSLYLWHWPILAFFRYSFLHFTTLHAVIAILLTVLFSLLTRKYIEEPLRKKHKGSFKKVFLIYFFIPALIVLASYKIIRQNDGFPQRLSPESLSTIQLIKEEFSSSKTIQHELFESYLIGDVAQDFTAVLWGDSHAQHYRGFLDTLGSENAFSAVSITTGDCQPLIGTFRLKHGNAPKQACLNSNQRFIDSLALEKIKTVYIAGRWAMYMETETVEGEKRSRGFIGDEQSKEESRANSQRVFRDGLIRTIELVHSKGKQVVIFEQVPAYNYDPANCSIKKVQYPKLFSEDCDVPVSFVTQRQKRYLAVFEEIKQLYPTVQVISLSNILCDEKACHSELDNTPVYFDNDHINTTGSRLLAEEYLLSNKASR